MADCGDVTFIPPKAAPEAQYRLWGKDRQTLADCRALNAAKAATITALQSAAQ